jgi:hypothetical protein
MSVKRGRAQINSDAPKDRRPNNQMSMDRKTTRERYEANEIAQKPVNRSDVTKANGEAIRKQQAKLKPIRGASQATDLNKAK